jgi:23S rRNA (uracil1939-C5)-methyltransferase
VNVVTGEKWIHGGRTLARLEGKVIFVEGLIPGERAEIQIFRQTKGFAEAEVIRITEPSSRRRTPKCRHAQECGGCQWQHIDYQEQLRAKTEILRDLFRRQAHIELPDDLQMENGTEWGYRRRARLVKSAEGWGYRRARSHEVIVPQECPVLIAELEDKICTSGLTNTVGGDLTNTEQAELQLLAGETIGMAHGHTFAFGDEVQIQVTDRTIYAHAGGFFQSNAPLLDSFVQHVLSRCEGGREAVELFSGVGFFTAWLQDTFHNVYSVERDPVCLKLAQKNTNHENVHFVSEDATRWLKDHSSSGNTPDLLLVDPPRTGLDKKLIQSLLRLGPKRLVYVSCDPATQARDVRRLCDAGYQLKSLRGFDLYPQTSHIETVAVLDNF